MITIGGVTLTTEEAREVLAWAREPLGDPDDPEPKPLPRFVMYQNDRVLRFNMPQPGHTWTTAPVTAALLEQLRDHCFPWNEVRRDEVQPGEVFRETLEGADCLAGQPESDSLFFRHWHSEYSEQRSVRRDATVLVRRPREVGTRLRDVEPGTLVERVDDGVRARVFDEGPEDGRLYVEREERPGTLHHWADDTLVRILEDE